MRGFLLLMRFQKFGLISIKKQYYIDNIDIIKEKKRLYYQNVIKPRKEQEKINKLKNLL